MLKTLYSGTQKGSFSNNVHKLNTTKFFCTTAKPVEPPASFVHPVLSLQTGEQVGTVELRKDLFGVPVRKDILHRAVVWKLACIRAGTGHAKSRGEMIGRKGKMRAQKGAGRARVGSRFTPSRKGGGTAFPPKPRDFAYTLPKKVRRLALKSALSAKFAQNKLIIVNNFDLETFKTRPFQKLLTARGWGNSCFVGKAEIDSNMHFASRNIPDILVQPQHKANVHDILKKEKLILHSEVLDYFHKRAEGLLPPLSKRGARRRKLKKIKAQNKTKAQMMAKERAEKLQATATATSSE